MYFKYSDLIRVARYSTAEYYKNLFKSHKQKRLEKFRDDWGNEIIRKRNFNLISQYFKAVRDNGQHDYVDDDTWSDLNMDKVFEKMDRCISIIGSQTLYKILRTYNRSIERLNDWSEQCSLFKKEKDYREEFQSVLSKLSENRTSNIVTFFRDELPERPKYYLLIYFSAFAVLLSTGFIFINPLFIFGFAFFGVINIIIKHYYDKRLFAFTQNLNYLYQMLRVAEKLGKLKNRFELTQIQKLHNNKKLIKSILGKLGYVLDAEELYNSPVGFLIAYSNYFLLTQLLSFFRTIDVIKENQDKLEEVFSAVGELDAAISIASYLDSLPSYTKPMFVSDNSISVEDIYHPLLSKPISNSFSLKNCSTLITGSNMAGKTTFIKTIALNMIFARTLDFCLAESASLPELIIKSLIKREDNIMEGTSYYFKEVEKMLSIIRMSEDNRKYIFIIDEIFRGTNTVERIAISTAVIEHISRHNISLITTHDIELQDILKNKIEMYHFSEQVENSQYFFDYKIKRGSSNSTNAIRLLELKNYPETITKSAYLMAKSMRNSDSLEKS